MIELPVEIALVLGLDINHMEYESMTMEPMPGGQMLVRWTGMAVLYPEAWAAIMASRS